MLLLHLMNRQNTSCSYSGRSRHYMWCHLNMTRCWLVKGGEQHFRIHRTLDFRYLFWALIKQEQKYDEALSTLNNCSDRSGGQVDMLYNLGILYLDGKFSRIKGLKQVERAKTYFQEFLEKSEDEARKKLPRARSCPTSELCAD